MHNNPIFENDEDIQDGYVIVDFEYDFFITDETDPEEFKDYALPNDLYRINVKLKENTNA